jgi:hypothetical protein
LLVTEDDNEEKVVTQVIMMIDTIKSKEEYAQNRICIEKINNIVFPLFLVVVFLFIHLFIRSYSN